MAVFLEIPVEAFRVLTESYKSILGFWAPRGPYGTTIMEVL